MAIKTLEIEIKGVSPLLMNSFPLVEIEKKEKMSREEQAELCAYRDPDTENLYVPGLNLQRAFVSAAAYSKGKGRASLQKIVAASVQVNPERLDLKTRKYAIDSRAVVVPATKGRIVRHRPRLDSWSLKFELVYEATLLTEAQVRRVVDDCGLLVGILDFRPERKGMFGKFSVVSWK